MPRSHKDSSAVADVWPSTSAFDGYLSALSPIQVRFFDNLGGFRNSAPFRVYEIWGKFRSKFDFDYMVMELSEQCLNR